MPEARGTDSGFREPLAAYYSEHGGSFEAQIWVPAREVRAAG
jgi:hypothetical protein